jgi:hypothetical protein
VLLPLKIRGIMLDELDWELERRSAGRRACHGFDPSWARKRKGFRWKQWSSQWLYEDLKLFNSYRVRRKSLGKIEPWGVANRKA